MLKHGEIIEKLNTLQKVAIVSSVLEGEPFERAGVPAVKKVLLNQLGKAQGVSYSSAARTWNPTLIGNMTEELVLEGAKESAKLFVTPDLKSTVDPLVEGLSEDAFLNGAIGAEIIRSVKGTGAAVGLSKPSLSADDIAYLDVREDAGAVHELFIKPFLSATKDSQCDAVFMNPSREGAGYYDTNRSILNEIQQGLLGEDIFVVGEGETFTADAVNMLRGRITLGGSTIPLERAARRYAQLKSFEAEGSIAHRELEESIRDGSALDDEKLDLLVDEIIDFAINVNSLEIRPESLKDSVHKADSVAADGEQAAWAERVSLDAEPHELSEDMHISKASRRRAAAESFVLLKNSGILPMAVGTKIAILGEAYGDMSLFEDKFHVVGKAQGYDRTKQRSDSLIPTAVRATDDADVVLLFLYPDETGREIMLPVNRLVILEALKRAGKRVVAIVLGDVPVDMGFDASVDALFVAPADGEFAGEALARILCGEENPSGKLVRSYYDRADGYFRAFRANRDAGRMRIGPFVGYRRYGLDRIKVRYPFGYGLTYTDFKYSQLYIDGENVTFTVTNCGKYDGYEVAQLYIGAPATKRITPKMQLRAFRKIFLRKGESKQITIPLSQDDFETFDPCLYTDNVEAGDYDIYIGASSQDIRLHGKKFVDGVAREQSGERSADYSPDGDYEDLSRVRRYERMVDKPKTSIDKLNILHKAAIYALPLLALIFFLLVSVLVLAYALDYILLTVAVEETVEWSLFVVAVAVISLVPILGSLNRKRMVRIRTVALIMSPILIAVCFVLGGILLSDNGGAAEKIALRIVSCFAVGTPIVAVFATLIDRQLWRTKMGKNHWDKYYFEVEHDGKMTSDTEFESAFHAAEIARETRAAEAKKVEEPVVADVPQFYDKKLTFTQLIRDCGQFATERGISVSESYLRNWIAALSSTQLIFVPKGGGAALAEIVAEYFGRKAYIDNAEKYARYEDLFAVWRPSGHANFPTSLATAIEAAGRETAYLHTALIRHVDSNLCDSLFRPFADVLARRKTALIIGERSVPIPQNLLVVVEVEDERVRLPESLAQVAAVLSPVCETVEPASRMTIVQTVGFERISAMCRTVRDEYPLGEEVWKKVDMLDEKCKSGHIGNHIWIKLEMHAAVIAACGGEIDEAIDGAMAAELIPWLSLIWKDDICDLSISGALSEIFGVDKIPECIALTSEGGKEEK